MADDTTGTCRYFVSYSGIKLPVRLVNPLEETDLNNRNTFIRAQFDAEDRLTSFEKMVYGAVELSHRYTYHANGAVSLAEIMMDEETTVLRFDEAGEPLA